MRPRPSLRGIMVGLSALVIVVMAGAGIWLKVRYDIADALRQEAQQTARLGEAARPLLLHSLVIGDLATAEQTLRSLNAGRTWRRVQLYEADGRALVVDASPPTAEAAGAPAWFQRLLGLRREATDIPIAAGPVVYGVLRVTPSFAAAEREVWNESQTIVVSAAVLLLTALGLITLALDYGLRPIRALARSAERLGGGDFAFRVPETNLREIAPAVQAFNAMAGNLERLVGELRSSESVNARLAAIVQQSEEAILTVDLARRITSWNLGASEMLGYPAADVVGRPLESLFSEAAGNPRDLATAMIDTRPPRRLETVFARRSGEALPVAGAASPLHDAGGVHTGHSLVVRDISERKRAEAELQRAKEQAESGNRAKAEFLTTMSHEIRTPMNGIIGLTELVLETELTAQQREYLGLVKTSAHSLLQVINDILDFSKIEAGRMDLDVRPFSLRAVIKETLGALGIQARDKGLELRASYGADVPDALVGDAGRLRQVLVNLVANAVKFTERGRVEVRVEVESLGDQRAVLHTSVADTGIGISEEKRELIFGAFTQADGSTTRRYGGTGLGLAITRRLVDLLGGRIWLESEVGKGSTFHFTTSWARSAGPLGASSGEGARAASPDGGAGPMRGLRVLLVEDNEVNRRLATALLEQRDHRVTAAETGRAALSALESQPFDVVLMDVEMPEMDGVSATSAIRAIEAEVEAGRQAPAPNSAFAQRTGRIPIVALTAHAMSGDEQRFLAAGMDAYLAKPIEAAALMALLDRLCARSAAAAPRGPGAGIDLAVALKNVANDRDLLRDLARVFIEDAPRQIAALERAVSAGDTVQARRAAHTLKGSISVFGASAAGALAAEIEEMARTGGLASADAAVVTLGDEVQRVLAVLGEVAVGAIPRTAGA